MADDTHDVQLIDEGNGIEDVQEPLPVPFKSKLWIYAIAGIALAGIAGMCLTVLIIIVSRR